MSTPVFARAAAVAAAVAACLLISTPAQAAPFPLDEGDTLYTVACDELNLAIFTLDPLTGAGTAVGAGSADDAYSCGYDPEWNYANSTAYTIAYGNGYALGTVDLASGVTTILAPITGATNYADSFAIDLDGIGYITNFQTLYTIDLTSGVTTLVGTIAGLDDYNFALATDPTTGSIYLLQQDGVLFLLDESALTASLVGTFPVANDPVYHTWGMTFDSAGTAWVITDQAGTDGSEPGLWSADIDNFDAPEFSGTTSFYTFTIFNVPGDAPAPAPAPALADTGLDAGTLIGSALALLAAGAVLIGMRRSTRRAA